jgi:hypothetical protein
MQWCHYIVDMDNIIHNDHHPPIFLIFLSLNCRNNVISNGYLTYNNFVWWLSIRRETKTIWLTCVFTLQHMLYTFSVSDVFPMNIGNIFMPLIHFSVPSSPPYKTPQASIKPFLIIYSLRWISIRSQPNVCSSRPFPPPSS